MQADRGYQTLPGYMGDGLKRIPLQGQPHVKRLLDEICNGLLARLLFCVVSSTEMSVLTEPLLSEMLTQFSKEATKMASVTS